ncbi:roadblock/LC7 domain-containing protein [Scytonema sp. NUACC26]|uniref:roadblock/LC7 domain-containing protein n=1 Tax=Scytonema sp. NUACC26 TaxID=3140176 RepID=UPI0034DBA529
MPLGKILNLLLVALERISAKPAKVTDELQTTEELPSTILVENTKVGAATISNLSPSTETSIFPQLEVFEEKNAIAVSKLQDELHNFVSSNAEVEGAIIITIDGLALASVLAPGMNEELTAAMSASMLSLGERIGRELDRGAIERVVVEGERGYGVLVNCTQKTILLVLASSAAKQGILFLEIKQAVAEITPLLK